MRLFVTILFIFYCFLTNTLLATDNKLKPKIYGNTNYSSSDQKSINTNLYFEYNYRLYESKSKKWGLFIAGKVNPAYDHLGNEMKMDVFTVLGIDF